MPIMYAEFDISSVDVPDGYKASQWLSFIPLQDSQAKPSALQNTNPGALSAPIPLRTYPALPSIQEQTASARVADPGSLADLPLWAYGLTCSHEFAEQDTVNITIDVNLAPSPPMLTAQSESDVFTALAQYVAVADELWTLLDPLIDSNSSTALPVSVNAGKTFADLANNVADAWGNRLSQDAGIAPQDQYVAGDSFEFEASVEYSLDGSSLSSFSLIADNGPGPGG